MDEHLTPSFNSKNEQIYYQISKENFSIIPPSYLNGNSMFVQYKNKNRIIFIYFLLLSLPLLTLSFYGSKRFIILMVKKMNNLKRTKKMPEMFSL